MPLAGLAIIQDMQDSLLLACQASQQAVVDAEIDARWGYGSLCSLREGHAAHMSTLLACPGISFWPSYVYGWNGEPAQRDHT